MTPTALVGTGEAARILDVSTETVRRWAADGDLAPVGRLGTRSGAALVFTLEDVQHLAADRERP